MARLVAWLGSPTPVRAQLDFMRGVLGGEVRLVRVADFDGSNAAAAGEVAKLLSAFGVSVVVAFGKRECLAALARELLRRGVEMWFAASAELHAEAGGGGACGEFDPDTDFFVVRDGVRVHKRFTTFLRVAGVGDGEPPRILLQRIDRADYLI